MLLKKRKSKFPRNRAHFKTSRMCALPRLGVSTNWRQCEMYLRKMLMTFIDNNCLFRTEKRFAFFGKQIKSFHYFFVTTA